MHMMRIAEAREIETQMVDQDMFSPPMTGEISPNIMFCKKTKEHVRIAPDGCAWVNMDAGGCIDTEASKNKVKRAPNGRAGHVFECMVTIKKYSMLANMVVTRREDRVDQ